MLHLNGLIVLHVKVLVQTKQILKFGVEDEHWPSVTSCMFTRSCLASKVKVKDRFASSMYVPNFLCSQREQKNPKRHVSALNDLSFCFI